MNERIKELVGQAKFMAEETINRQISKNAELDAFAEKFAELIVRKFDDILVLEYVDCVGNKDKQAEERVQRLREKVKTYFGVEE